MAKCSFCGCEIQRGTGKIFVKKEGAIFRFCSNKCEKNMLVLKRNPQKTRWTEAFARAKEISTSSKKAAKEKAPSKNKKGG